MSGKGDRNWFVNFAISVIGLPNIFVFLVTVTQFFYYFNVVKPGVKYRDVGAVMFVNLTY
jgi:hypothetical protein